MKINELNDIDLSKYKIAYFQGDSLSHDKLTQDEVMKLAGAGHNFDKDAFECLLKIALIPKYEQLTNCDGDDWDIRPADANASGFYKYPEGTIFLGGTLGEELKIKDEQNQ